MTVAHVIVKGLVQGVNFRFHTKRNADRLGVKGWVRNLPDGSVEGCFEGEEAPVKALIDWCRQGPDAARVEQVRVQYQSCNGNSQFFAIIR